ncbi:MAG TPA: phosphatase PAP2 family protein [Solirubrobacteraceae bacterium]
MTAAKRSAALVALVGALGAAVHWLAPLGALDLGAVRDAHRVALAGAAAAARAVTGAGGTHAILAVTAAAAAALLAARRRADALALAAGVAATEAAVAGVKHLVLRARPPAADAIAHAAGYSFPSGHAAASLALYAGIAVVLCRGRARMPRLAIGAATALVLLAIGLSRVLLGVHCPTDVVGGWLLAGAITLAVGAAREWGCPYLRAPAALP